jgi:hypothetical protein
MLSSSRAHGSAAPASLVLLLMLVGCDTGGPVAPGATPAYLGLDVSANPHNAISAVALVKARLADSAFVRFWSAGGAVTTSPAYAFHDDTLVVVPVLGLDTARMYEIEAGLWFGDSVAMGVDTATFHSGSLPAWVPTVGTSGADTSPGFLALSFRDGPVIIDNTGKVVWYRHFPNGTLNSFQAHADGRYTVLGLDDAANAFRILDELGNETGALACTGYPTRFHDLRVEADGTAWILCDDTRVMDLSGVGGANPAAVTATVVQHLDRSGEVLFQWNAFDHFAITDLAFADRTGESVNFTHGNGVTIDTDGNLLLSFRSLNEITKVDVRTGAVLWRFGGLRNQFTLVNDSRGPFQWQHGLRVVAPGQIQILDNRFSAPSRFVLYLLNPQAMTALAIVEFVDGPQTWANVGGSTDAIANGHAVVSFGRAGRVVEVDESGNRAWEVTGTDGVYIFRAQRIASLYSAQRR